MKESKVMYEDAVATYSKKIQESSEILPANKAELLKYFKTGFGGKAVPTIAKNAQVLFTWAKTIKKPFKAMKRADLEPSVETILNNKQLTQWSKLKYLSCICRLFRVLHGKKRGHPPAVIEWIEFTKPTRNNGIDFSMLLTPNDVKRLIAATRNARDRFLLALFFDTGCRSISELEPLNCSSLQEKDGHLEISFTHSKTVPRTLPVINCLPYYKEWLQVLQKHGGGQPKTPIFVEFGTRGDKSTAWKRRLGYAGMVHVAQGAAKRAKIGKPVRLHWFRKSTASLYSNHFNNTVLLDRWFGWSGGIHDAYIGLDVKKLFEQYLLFYNSKDNELRPLQCTKCGKVNCGHLEFCSDCQMPLFKKVVVAEDLEKHKHNLELLQAIKTQGKTDAKIVELIASLLEQIGTSEVMLAKN